MMQISLLILLGLPYLIIISFFIVGWKRKQVSNSTLPGSKPFVSILVPVKNEAKNLPVLIGDLLRQHYSPGSFEIIFIDDFSNDNSGLIIKEYLPAYSFLKLLSFSENRGKKAALWEAIQVARGELILTIDGDCRLSEHWLESMVDYYLRFPMHLLIGPVFMKQTAGLWSHFQCLEFLSLIASGAGAAGIGHPILCNGANLGGHRSLFQKASEVYHSAIASGDDIFLLLKLKSLKIPAIFVKNRNAVVETENKSSFKQYINQRTRWTFKSRFYRDRDIIMVAIIVLLTNVILIGELFYSLFHERFVINFLLFYLLKCFVDYILLYNVAKFFNRTKLLRYFLVHQLLYIFYVSLVGIAGHFLGEPWKNKKKVLINDYGRNNLLEKVQEK